MKTTKKKEIVQKAERLKELQNDKKIKELLKELADLKKFFKDNFEESIKAGEVLVVRTEKESERIDPKLVRAEASEELLEAVSVLSKSVTIKAE